MLKQKQILSFTNLLNKKKYSPQYIVFPNSIVLVHGIWQLILVWCALVTWSHLFTPSKTERGDRTSKVPTPFIPQKTSRERVPIDMENKKTRPSDIHTISNIFNRTFLCIEYNYFPTNCYEPFHTSAFTPSLLWGYTPGILLPLTAIISVIFLLYFTNHVSLRADAFVLVSAFCLDIVIVT